MENCARGASGPIMERTDGRLGLPRVIFTVALCTALSTRLSNTTQLTYYHETILRAITPIAFQRNCEYFFFIVAGHLASSQWDSVLCLALQQRAVL